MCASSDIENRATGQTDFMPPFMPLDDSIHWNVGKAVEVSKGFTAVFGTSSAYEAYLFTQLFRQLGAKHLLGSGCNEKEVEDLVHASAGPTLLFVVDNIARDCGISLVRRLKGQHPDLKVRRRLDRRALRS